MPIQFVTDPLNLRLNLGTSRAQMSRLNGDEDIFTLDRLVDAAARVGFAVRMTATRPYRSG